MNIDQAREEALRRWPYGDHWGPDWNRAGGVKHGLLLQVGVVRYDEEKGYPQALSHTFEVKGWGNTWEEAFADAERREKVPREE